MNTIDEIIKYITKNWRYIKEEELLNLIDQSYNFGFDECENFNEKIFNDDKDSNKYEEGYNDGHEEGYNDGRSEGHEEGYNDGHEEGYNDGRSECHEEGTNDR